MAKQSDTFSISEMRSKAASLRQQADRIDATATAVERIMNGAADALMTPAPTFAPRHVRAKGGKGKAPGTLNMVWRNNFARVSEVAGAEPFGLDLMVDILHEMHGREVKPSALRRQFKSYVEHGYLWIADADSYQITNKLRALIGAPAVPNENAPPPEGSGDGADTALDALNGRPQE